MKELPFFKFRPDDYIQGEITLCSETAQGVFMHICAWYWSKQCFIDKKTIERRIIKNRKEVGDAFQELLEENIIKVDKSGDFYIEFLDEQFDELQENHQKKVDAGRQGGLKSGEKRRSTSSSASAKPKQTSSNKEEEEDKEQEQDKEKEKEKDLSDGDSKSPEKKQRKKDDTPYQKIVDLYNEITAGHLPACETISEGRKKVIRARFTEYGFEKIKTAFELAVQSDFICGRSDHSTFKGGFDWILTARYFPKIIEGYYKNNKNDKRNITGDENFDINA